MIIVTTLLIFFKKIVIACSSQFQKLLSTWNSKHFQTQRTVLLPEPW